MNPTEKLKILITQNKTKQVIVELKALTKDTSLYDEVIQQAAKLNQYETDKRAGTHSSGALDIKRNRIDQSLLSIIEELQTTDKNASREVKQRVDGKENTKSLWQYITAAAIIIGILGSLAEVANFINIIPNKSIGTAHTVTVLVHGKDGKDQLVLPNRGLVYLVYGDAKIPEQVNNKGLAIFNQIPERFFSTDAKVEIFFEDPKGEPYRVAHRDTTYDLKYQTYIPLLVKLEGMEQIKGKVEDFETGDALDSVAIRLFGKTVLSNVFGEFILDIPEDEQRQFITLSASKDGYQKWEDSNIPTTTNQLITIPLKKE